MTIQAIRESLRESYDMSLPSRSDICEITRLETPPCDVLQSDMSMFDSSKRPFSQLEDFPMRLKALTI